jgi:NAD-dependent deacetylase
MDQTLPDPLTGGPLRRGESVVAFTGAGISKESGLPTFREAQVGLWARYSPEELATPEAFARHPDLVWRWYAWRRELVKRAVPNPAHRALATLEERLEDAFTLVTQNVDGLHRRAGSRRVLELHGDLLRTICSVDRDPVDEEEIADGEPPPCPRCGAPLRPDVVWFGEMLPAGTLREAFEAASNCDLMLVVGTSGRVHPAAALVPVALESGARVVVVDPGEPGWSHPRVHHLRGEAGRVLPGLVDSLAPVGTEGGPLADGPPSH